MKNFVFQMPVKVYFGENEVKNSLANELKKYGSNIMLAYGKGSIKRNGIYDEIVNVLKENNKNIIDFPDIPSNPTYEKVLEGIKLYKEEKIDLILAVGGGSVIDCCKIITAGAYVDEDLWELELEKNIIPEKMGNFAVISTLTGAGAEMNNLGAVTRESTHEKKTFVGSYAKFAIMDPTYIMTVPLNIFMPGVYDSLSHCMETYFGKITNVCDAMNEGLMKDIIANMKELINGNDTLEVRSNLMWDSSLIQTFLFQVGKLGDFQVHGIENMLAAYSHGTHGRQLAVLQPVYYRHVYKSNPQKFARFAKNVMNINSDKSEEEIALLGIEAIEQLIKSANLATTFTDIGYDLTEEVAKKVSETCKISIGNSQKLSREEIYNILMACK